MGLFHRLNKRKSTASTEQVALNQLLDWLGVSELDGGELSNATYFACLKVLSESIGKLPLKLQQATPTSGIRIAREHRYYRMLNERPNRYMTATVFWSTMELCRNHYGNAYALIDTSDPRAPQLWPLPPRSVQVLYDNAKMLKDTPDLYYAYGGNTGTVVFGSEEILHFKSHCTLDGLVGVSVREQLAGTIHGSVKAQKMINKMYESGMTAKAVLQYTGSLKDASKDALTKGIEAYARGEMKSKGIENIMVDLILTTAGVTYRHARFPSPPSGTYAVYLDDIETDGPDGMNRIYRHGVTVEVYEPFPDADTEAAIEAALDAEGIPWTKQDRYWLQSEQLYQVIYEFDYIEKRRA